MLKTFRQKITSQRTIKFVIIGGLLGIFLFFKAPDSLRRIVRARNRAKRNRSYYGFRVIPSGIHGYREKYGHYPIYTGWWHHDIVEPEHWGWEGEPGGEMYDGWGTKYWYTSTDGQHYTLTSFGKNGKPGYTNNEFDSDIVFVDGDFVACSPHGIWDGERYIVCPPNDS